VNIQPTGKLQMRKQNRNQQQHNNKNKTTTTNPTNRQVEAVEARQGLIIEDGDGR
jgi:hypothetical protein